MYYGCGPTKALSLWKSLALLFTFLRQKLARFIIYIYIHRHTPLKQLNAPNTYQHCHFVLPNISPATTTSQAYHWWNYAFAWLLHRMVFLPCNSKVVPMNRTIIIEWARLGVTDAIFATLTDQQFERRQCMYIWHYREESHTHRHRHT